MVPDVGRFFCGKDIVCGRFEEPHDPGVIVDPCIGHIDNRLGMGQCAFQSLTSNGVDSRGGRGRQCLAAEVTEPVYQFRAHHATATKDDNLHL